MKCRLATKNNLPELKYMFDAIVRNMHDNGITIWNEFYPYEEFENDIDNENLYLLTDNNKIVATFVLCGVSSEYGCFQWSEKTSKVLYLKRIGVNINYLRQGVGSLIIKCAIDIAKIKNIEYLRLTVADSNQPAINLYKKQEFKQVFGTYKEHIEERDLTLIEYGFELKINKV